jgi:hypothetical protein
MSRFSFRPQVEALDGRCLPSGNPTISIGDAIVTEGDSGQTALVFHVTLSKPTSKEVSVSFATQDGTATTAGNDYEAASGTLKFAPGETDKTITVLVNGDTTYEGPVYAPWGPAFEAFYVNLNGAGKGVKIADAQGSCVISDDDPNPYYYELPPDDNVSYPGFGGE